ncbi:MAG: DUF1353 domain-containing protein [bacterium]|nr:DUF1353 domain-containing protein [bacterium]
MGKVSSRHGSFTDLDVRILKDGRKRKLLKPLVAILPRITVVAKKGFVTDFASVPRLFWRILPPFGKYAPAAVIHDYLYFTGVVPRKMADQAFLDGMKILKVPFWKRVIMHRAVRMGGWYTWNKHRRGAYGDNPHNS